MSRGWQKLKVRQKRQMKQLIHTFFGNNFKKNKNKRWPEYWPLTQVKGMVCDIGIKSKRKKKRELVKKMAVIVTSIGPLTKELKVRTGRGLKPAAQQASL